MCCEATDFLVENRELITSQLAIPAFALQQIKKSWDREPPWGSVYGRFDVCFGGLNHPDPRLRVPKLYEFNADTPVLLVESASIQWLWLEQTGHGNDQLNSITERLIEAWKRNLALIEQELGIASRRFYDQEGEHIDVIFKLYPWRYMVESKFGEAYFKDMERIGQRNKVGEYIGGTVWIEPPYKMLWSNKALFAILWQLFKNDPRSQWLLPTYFDTEAPASLTSFARKPIFAGQGADVVLQADGRVIQDTTTGDYGKEGYVVQELALLPEFKAVGNVSYYPVLSLWVVDGKVSGMGVREDKTPITTNGSMFIPHSISDGPINYERQSVPNIDEIEAS